MNDLNFFYVDTKKENDGGIIKIALITTIIAVICILSTLIVNTLGIYWTQNSIDNLNSEMNKEEFTANYAESLTVANEKKILTTYNDKLNIIFESISHRNVVNPDLINKINYTIPKEVYFKSMNFSGGILEISASSTNRDAIAKFQHNIDEVEFIEESHIGGIMSDLAEGNKEVFTFTITCKVKEGYYNENK